MNRRILTAGTAILMIAGTYTAEAETLAGPVEADSQAMQSADQIGGTSIRQQIQSQLSKAGFTSVNITPSSFLVRAKDKMGNPVEMVIGPDSFTEITEVAPKAAAGDANSTSPKVAPPATQPAAPKG